MALEVDLVKLIQMVEVFQSVAVEVALPVFQETDKLQAQVQVVVRHQLAHQEAQHPQVVQVAHLQLQIQVAAHQDVKDNAQHVLARQCFLQLVSYHS